MDDDGLREDKDGNKLTINFASMSGGETAQPLADYYIQQWKEIGLDVQYTTGRLIEFNSFYDKLENDDPEIDVYQAAWNTELIQIQVDYGDQMLRSTTLVMNQKKIQN